MRPVTVDPHNTVAAIRELASASQENDIVSIAQAFSITGTVTPTTNLNVSAPTLANVVAVLGTLLEVMQKGNINRTT
jgi:hypothetical protein